MGNCCVLCLEKNDNATGLAAKEDYVLGNAYVDTVPDLPAGQYVVIAVSDTGCGMPPDILERAVEPFFTIKDDGRGTGLGLSMAFGFVKQSGGHFRINIEMGHGTTVKVYFPRVHAAEEVAPMANVVETVGDNQTILVVKDDLSVQATVVDMLTSSGDQVLKADNADAALTALKSGAHCDLLFTDVVMPGKLKVTDLAQQAKALRPRLGGFCSLQVTRKMPLFMAAGWTPVCSC